MSLQECRLEKDLVNINIKYASLRYNKNYEAAFKGTGKYGAKILKPVFLTEFDHSECEKVESKTKVETFNKTVKIIDETLDKDIMSAKVQELEKKRGFKKIISSLLLRS